jgi:hypothetical protein
MFSFPLSEQLAVFHITDELEACFYEFFASSSVLAVAA